MDVNAQFIKNRRQQNLWSQQQLSDMTGLSLRTLQRVEKTSSASLETVKSLASVFEVSPSEILKGDNNVFEEAPQSHPISSTKLKAKRRRLIIGLFLVCLVNAITLFILFDRHEKGLVEPSTFYFLKNFVSITTVLSVVVTLVQGFRKKIFIKNDFW